MPVVGARIGRIRVEAVLGKGGMGDVYVGHDETLERRVALKSIQAGRRLSTAAKARFVREAQILSRLDHPNICKIYDFIEAEDREYLVLELIRGRNLTAAIREGLSLSERLSVARQVADALVAAHAEGVVHRDLKPENVMLTDSGEVKVLDFGLARTDSVPPGEHPPMGAATGAPPPPGEPTELLVAGPDRTLPDRPGDLSLAPPGVSDPPSSSAGPYTALGAIMGTLTYMSPEQARGEYVSTPSDMYSFGLLLQTLFTGRGPYPRDADREQVFRQARAADTLPVTGLDGDLTRLIESLKETKKAECKLSIWQEAKGQELSAEEMEYDPVNLKNVPYISLRGEIKAVNDYLDATTELTCFEDDLVVWFNWLMQVETLELTLRMTHNPQSDANRNTHARYRFALLVTHDGQEASWDPDVHDMPPGSA